MKKLIAALALLVIAAAPAVALKQWNGATYDAVEVTKVFNQAEGSGTWSKSRASTVVKYDIRLLREGAQRGPILTYPAGKVGVLYRGTVKVACTPFGGRARWQTQVRGVRRTGEAGPWSTSVAKRIAC